MRKIDDTDNKAMKESNAIKSMKLLIDIFNKTKLDYWLDYGALLGAVRDKKFIPWDNDIEPYVFIKNKADIFKVIAILEYKHFEIKEMPESRGYSKGIKIKDREGYAHMSIGWYKTNIFKKILGIICYYLPLRKSIIRKVQLY